jgi:two-component system OmpR family sensor kinase
MGRRVQVLRGLIPKTLFTKLALALTVLLLGIGLLYSVLSTYLTRHYQQEFLQNLNRDLASNLITERELVSDGVINQDALKKTFMHFMMVNPSIEIYMLDAAGNILSYSADPGQVKRKKVDMQPVMDFTEGKAFPLLGDDPRSFERRKIFSVAPISISDGSMRYLYVVLRGEEYERVERLFQESFLLQLSGAAVFVSLLIGFMVGLLLFMVLTRRLQTLTRLMQRFSESQFTQHDLYPDSGGGGDEIDTLGHHYNSMAKRIREQLDDLKKQDDLRRELIANVSHDLRTPLAALQGYIETLELKAGEFDEQTRAEYLDIALKHSRRLTRLVEELFELATLDAKEMPLHIEAFAPAELVQDVIQKFSLSAEADNMKLVMQAPDSLPFVYADIGLIERVLENLIGNALRHTPADGEITVVLRQQESEVEIDVRDNGSGIAAAELQNIFDRFYRVDNMERSNHHAGLGLAIAQHIVTLHGSEIRVESEPGSGSRFIFGLPIWIAQG